MLEDHGDAERQQWYSKIARTGRGERLPLDDQLKGLMQDLGNAINESLADSDRIAGAIGEIKRAGYDVFLVLEATIGFNKRDPNGSDSEMAEGIPAGETHKVTWTSQDQKFLKALKISLEEDSK